jgi:hypothetical protein
MNPKMVEFARTQILNAMEVLPELCHRTFKLMYARNKGKRSVEDALSMKIEDVVLEIPEEQLSWALSQVDRSVDDLANKQS